MQTQCNLDQREFESYDGYKVVAGFDGGAVTSDAGARLLRHLDRSSACDPEPKIDPAGICDNDLKTLKIFKSTVVNTYAGRGPATKSIYE